jgi:hypothetical protein
VIAVRFIITELELNDTVSAVKKKSRIYISGDKLTSSSINDAIYDTFFTLTNTVS